MMENKKNYIEEDIRQSLEKMRREEPMKFLFMIIKKEIEWLFRNF